MEHIENRPVIRELFLSKDKKITILFYTSNLVKFLHARTVLQRLGLILGHFKSKSDPYSEEYTGTNEQLLERAINEVRNSVGAGSLFFVEDTSLRIEALSTDNSDFPGMAVKEWFAKTTFEDLDAQLRERDMGRTAAVFSSIALHVPGLQKPVYFQGYTKGEVAISPPTFYENAQHPWLTPNSFNGWFIPNGSSKRLGEMSFEESWDHDFRVKSLVRLVDRLEEYQAVLNLGPRAYTRLLRAETSKQHSLFPTERPVLVVVGRTCAGKTTFGDYAFQEHKLQFVEASSVIRTFRNEFVEENLTPFEFARRVLESKGPDVVARKIVELYAREIQRGLVITGFRTIEEVEVVKKYFTQCKIVWIEATERTRFERYLARARDNVSVTFREFRRLDLQQSQFGLLRVAQDFADTRITNEGALHDYHEQINAVITGHKLKELPGISMNVHPRYNTEHNQLYECLSVLNESGSPLSCDELQGMTSSRGHEIRHNNANKVLKRSPELVRRWELEGSRVRYEILNAGRAYLRLMEERATQDRT